MPGAQGQVMGQIATVRILNQFQFCSVQFQFFCGSRSCGFLNIPGARGHETNSHGRGLNSKPKCLMPFGSWGSRESGERSACHRIAGAYGCVGCATKGI